MQTSRETPGPGSYRPPSDFGYVDLMKSPRTQQSPRSSLTGTNFMSARSKNGGGPGTASFNRGTKTSMTKYTDSLKDSSMQIRNRSTMMESSEDHH
jgi:hypothetical protein